MKNSPVPHMKDEAVGNPGKKETKYGKYEDWEIKGAADTLSEAEEIKADPEKMKHVEAHMNEKVAHTKKALGNIKEVGSIDELKEIRKSKLKKSSE